jgi:SAM-dependent methyltransferase
MRRAVLRVRDGYRHLESPWPLRWVAPMVGRLRYRDEIAWGRGGRALDVGCGSGGWVRHLAALGWDAEGLEPDPRAAAGARAAGTRVQEGAFGEVALEAAAYDLVAARHVIEHLPDPRAFLAEARRVLRPGGRLFLLTPNADARERARFAILWAPNDPPRHLVLFPPQALATLVAEAGFADVRVRTRSTPKAILDSLDLARGRRGIPSRHVRWRRALARPRVWLADLLGRGDEIRLEAVAYGPVGSPR